MKPLGPGTSVARVAPSTEPLGMITFPSPFGFGIHHPITSRRLHVKWIVCPSSRSPGIGWSSSTRSEPTDTSRSRRLRIFATASWPQAVLVRWNDDSASGSVRSTPLTSTASSGSLGESPMSSRHGWQNATSEIVPSMIVRAASPASSESHSLAMIVGCVFMVSIPGLAQTETALERS
jgi:hypothetical protein